MSIERFLREYAERETLRLHTPGHKGRIDALDITELVDGSFPGDIVAAAEQRIAAVYGAKHAHLLACGSSQGVKAAIYHAAADGIIDVNSHRSVYDGFKLAGRRATTVGERGSVRPITVGDIEAALTPDIGVVVVTSPTYFGFCADIDGIAEFCKRRGLTFIIDGAHGAHFGFSPLLPPAFASKCDMCNVSAHKTLCALNQGAILFDDLSENIGYAADIMGTTSPSYPLYASIESAVEKATRSSGAYEALYGHICELRAGLPFLKNDDFTRPVLDCAALGIAAKELCSALVRAGVYPELVTDRYIVFLFTAADGADDVKRLDVTLRQCIRELR